MAKNRRRGRRMQFLDMIMNLRKDKLATDRYISDNEVKLAGLGSGSPSTQTSENQNIPSNLGKRGGNIEQSIIDYPSFKDNYIAPDYLNESNMVSSSFVPKNNNYLMYFGVGIVAFLLFGKKLFKKR